MFMSSVAHFLDDYTAVQNVTGQRTAAVQKYKIVYRYWVGSLAITLTIIFMILPTFWGFWLLRGKVTLSPVDAAKALEAPLVLTERDVENPKSRMKEIGPRPLYPVEEAGGSTNRDASGW